MGVVQSERSRGRGAGMARRESVGDESLKECRPPPRGAEPVSPAAQTCAKPRASWTAAQGRGRRRLSGTIGGLPSGAPTQIIHTV